MFEREGSVKILDRPCVSSTDHTGIAIAELFEELDLTGRR